MPGGPKPLLHWNSTAPYRPLSPDSSCRPTRSSQPGSQAAVLPPRVYHALSTIPTALAERLLSPYRTVGNPRPGKVGAPQHSTSTD